MSDFQKHAMCEANRTFRALRAVGFLITELQGNATSDWDGEPLEDLGILIEHIAGHGVKTTEEGIEGHPLRETA